MIELNTKADQSCKVPTIFYGTAWKGERTETVTLDALSVGYAGIDTANQPKHYNEAGVGAAIQVAIAGFGIRRSELFVQTKYTYQHAQDQRTPYCPYSKISAQVRQSLESSLRNLGTTYVDCLLLHGPFLPNEWLEEDWQAWRSMEEAAREGLCLNLGISNVNVSQLLTLLEGATIPPRFVQNRCTAQNGWDRSVRDLCRQFGLGYQAFSLLLGNSHVLSSRAMRDIALRHNKTAHQVLLSLARSQGICPITGTSDATHMRENIEGLVTQLTSSEIYDLLHFADDI